MQQLQIDPEFKALIPPLSVDEYAGLKISVISEGCRDAIITWNNIIIDGHNRYEICTQHDIPFNVIIKDFPERDDVIDWIYSNQLSRRNLSDESRTYLMGEQYKARKKRFGAPEGNVNASKQRGQNVPIVISEKTADKIASEQDVSAKTVQRAAEYSTAVNTLQQNVGIETLKHKILSGDINTTKKGVIALADAPIETQKKIIETLLSGKAKGMQDAKRIVAAESIKDTPILSGKYKVIYVDPPWQYGGSMNITYGTADKHYPTMSLEDICNLPVIEISEDDSVLFLWATSPMLPEAMYVIMKWGFKYKASFVWDKIKHVMGHYNSVRHEFLLVATKGSCTPEIMKLFDSVISEERTEHSAKPETFRTIIDTLYPSGKRIELFARNTFDNWDIWGNQV